MDELQNIKSRLTSLEAKLEVQDDYAKALKETLFHVAEALHRKGVIPMQELAGMVEASHAFARGAFGRSKIELLAPLAKSMREIGEALDAAGQGPSAG